MRRSANKPLFVDVSDQVMLMARVNSLKGPIQIEALMECPLGQSPEQIGQTVAQFSGLAKGQLCPSVCGVYPREVLVRRASLDNPARAKDPAYLLEMVQAQFKVDVNQYAIMVLNAAQGTEFRLDKAVSKELLFCGAARRELQSLQEQLLSYGLYPERLELSTLATIGGLVHDAELRESKAPTLVLEITDDHAQVLIFQGESLDVARPIPHGFDSMYPLVQEQLGLKDVESARKLFSSNTFDFTEMGPLLLKKMLKELQASTGFYEVQTGQTIGQLFLSNLPDNLDWIARSLSRTLCVDMLEPDYERWLTSLGIELGEGVDVSRLGPRWFSLFALMGNYNPTHSPV
ncbi:MAG: hypothetical protein ACQKBW_08435, partial [Puniceicoccales bacterium]